MQLPLGLSQNAPALFDPLSLQAAPAPAAVAEAEPFSPVILDIRGSSFLNNTAIDQTGGAMALGSVINEAAIVNCTFTGNSAPSVSGSGGAITIFSNNLFTIAGISRTECRHCRSIAMLTGNLSLFFALLSGTVTSRTAVVNLKLYSQHGSLVHRHHIPLQPTPG